MKNIKDLLVDATKYPAAIEARLPEAFPKISTILVDAAGRIPTVPDFPIDIPALPAVPEIPEMPALPGGAGLRRYVTGVEVKPREAPPTPARAIAVSPEREKIPLVFE